MKRFATVCWMVILFAALHASGQGQAIATSQSPHGSLNVPCANCHTAQGWKPIRAVPEFDHNQTKYPLRGMHVGVACTACHVKMVFTNVGNKCADCHADIHKKQLGANCEQCHTVRGWGVSIQQIQDHNNRFPLTGAHAAVDCDACHKNAGNSKFETMSTNCLSCHMADFKRVKNPDHVAGGSAFQAPCEQCHTTDNWLNAKFDHATTGFLLTGGHADPPRTCADCHSGPNSYNLAGATCVSCHLKVYQSAKNPDHVAGGFAQTCQDCHTVNAWQPATFDHSKTNFPLTGLHTDPPRVCTDCHNAQFGNYNITVTTCVSCHLSNFQGAKNPDHVASGFAQTCELCHNTTAWQPATFDHSKTAFPLTGAHGPPLPCASCHVNNNYNITVTTCVSCHLDKYQGAKNPDHVAGAFPQTCEVCHNTTAWQPAKFDHATTGWPLTGMHVSPGARQCTDCHNAQFGNYNITVTTCISCHQSAYNGAKTPVDHANFPTTCENCHDTTAWANGKFDHASTGWPLTGMHTSPSPRACTDCHNAQFGNYNITVTTCVSCHLALYQGAKNPDHVAGAFPQTCDLCHNTSAWQPAKFDHSQSGFPLTGAHVSPPLPCANCHVNNNYQITVITCVSCHLDKYQSAKSPDHVASAFPQTCEGCHNTTAWQPATFDHASTGWPLTGSHVSPGARQCTDCHNAQFGNYNITVTTCISCHQTDYNGAKTPVDHTNFPTTCEQCHDTSVWTNGKFDHATTGWPLTGSHVSPGPRQCTDCHNAQFGNYHITVTTCISCHQTDYNGAKTPVDHTSFPTTCEQCHDTSLWTNATFNHASTGWPLTGSHVSPGARLCTDCHNAKFGNYNITVTTCISCHQTDYNGAKTPVDHTSFPTTCESCHDTTLWTNATFNHASTGWPLTGSHVSPGVRQCTDCHNAQFGNYNITVTTCISCHQADYNGAKTPVDHTSFPTTCETCHDTSLWTNSTFNHANTGWPLTGSHVSPGARLCTDCHNAQFGNYNITVTTCVSCHQADYNGAKTPVDHAGFPTTCENCHDTSLWTNGKFDHATTGWPLVGAHVSPGARQCTDCHNAKFGNYNITVTTCISCHQTDFAGATTPVPHTGFPTTCELCHDTVLWTDATFNHNNTAFPLTGMHQSPQYRACADCHVNSNYTSLPLTCIGCHQTLYNGTTNPGHAAQPTFFPTAQCSTCHTTAGWTPAIFNHTQYTQFPITHGNANGVCATCHTNSNDYSIFQCTQCHGGNNSANFNHPNVNGYVYNSVNCYQCHSSAGG